MKICKLIRWLRRHLDRSSRRGDHVLRKPGWDLNFPGPNDMHDIPPIRERRTIFAEPECNFAGFEGGLQH